METFVRLTKLIYLDTFLGINKFETIVPQIKAATGSSVGLGMEGEALRSSSRHNAGTAKNAGKSMMILGPHQYTLLILHKKLHQTNKTKYMA
jgi:hypothetical protein